MDEYVYGKKIPKAGPCWQIDFKSLYQFILPPLIGGRCPFPVAFQKGLDARASILEVLI